MNSRFMGASLIEKPGVAGMKVLLRTLETLIS
jgi:hypothetical protein